MAGYSVAAHRPARCAGALEQNELTVAKQVAGYASSHIENMLSMLRVDARILDLTRSAQNEPPSPQALNQVLWLVYHQNDDFCAVAMFDEHGALIGKPASLEDPEPLRIAEEPRADAPDRRRGRRLDGAARRRAVVGPGHRPDLPGRAAALPHVVLAVAFDPSYGGGKRILAAEVSLKRLANYVASLSTPDVDVKLLDGRGPPVRGRVASRGSTSWSRSASGRARGELPPATSSPNTSNGKRT
jgi:hypothetical protein